MFTIEIYFPKYKSWSGLEALDMRRKLGLPDGVRLESPKVYPATVDPATTQVDEGFARVHFEPSDIVLGRTVDLAHLVAGDVAVADRNQLCWSKDISPGRIMYLWLGAKMAEMESELAAAMKRIDGLLARNQEIEGMAQVLDASLMLLKLHQDKDGGTDREWTETFDALAQALKSVRGEP